MDLRQTGHESVKRIKSGLNGNLSHLRRFRVYGVDASGCIVSNFVTGLKYFIRISFVITSCHHLI
jgi:hypothetical protein